MRTVLVQPPAWLYRVSEQTSRATSEAMDRLLRSHVSDGAYVAALRATWVKSAWSGYDEFGFDFGARYSVEE